MKKGLFTLLIASLLTGCNKPSYTSISMSEGIERMKEETNYILVDVRTEQEYIEGHIPEAINIPNESITTSPKELQDKNQLIFVYCRSGSRSKQAAKKLVKLGYTNIIEMGGILDYKGDLSKG